MKLTISIILSLLFHFEQITVLCMSTVLLCVHVSAPVAFLGDIALDEDDLRMFKEAQSGEDEPQPIQTNQTHSGTKANGEYSNWRVISAFF